MTHLGDDDDDGKDDLLYPLQSENLRQKHQDDSVKSSWAYYDDTLGVSEEAEAGRDRSHVAEAAMWSRFVAGLEEELLKSVEWLN